MARPMGKPKRFPTHANRQLQKLQIASLRISQFFSMPPSAFEAGEWDNMLHHA